MVPAAGFTVTYEMAVTLADLQRLYPHLEGGQHGRMEGHSVTSDIAASKRWRLTLANARSRRVGSLEFPLADLRVELWGFAPTEAERFLERLHLVFRRGGG